MSLGRLASLEIPALPALTRAKVESCSAEVERALATQPALASIELYGGDLDAWTGAPALTT